MGARKFNQQHIRNITQNSSGTYSITLPKQLIRELRWQRHQQLTVRREGKKLIVEDWSE
jgi:hypothetical protein